MQFLLVQNRHQKHDLTLIGSGANGLSIQECPEKGPLWHYIDSPFKVKLYLEENNMKVRVRKDHTISAEIIHLLEILKNLLFILSCRIDHKFF